MTGGYRPHREEKDRKRREIGRPHREEKDRTGREIGKEMQKGTQQGN